MFNRSRAGLLGATLLVSACGATLSATVLEDMQAVLSDAKAILTVSGTVIPYASDATLVVDGLQAVLTVIEDNSGSTSESAAIADITAAVKQTMADLPTNTQVQTDGQAALTLLEALSSTSDASALQQAYTAAGVLLIDYLQSQQTVSAHRYGAASSGTQSLIDDANQHLNNLKAGRRAAPRL